MVMVKNKFLSGGSLIISVLIFLILFSIFLFFPQKIILADSFKRPFIKPADGEIIVGFRQEYLDIEKNVKRKHTGIDIAGNPGDIIFAAGNGMISYCGISPIGGLTVVIKHNDKIRSTYLNLNSVCVGPGDKVKQGEKIGTIGSFDDPSSELCHLHFGIIYDEYYLDPEGVLGIDYSSISRFIVLKFSEGDYVIE
jgi:murein DD-endopeptidase MepM/ murein hydrolase activator NlpD